MSKYFLLIASILLSCKSIGQETKASLDIDDLKMIIDIVDTLKAKNNYHILVNEGWIENSYLCDLWINDKLAGTLFESVDKKLCQYYEIEDSYIFKYDNEGCWDDIPKELFVSITAGDDTDFPSTSPFIDNTFHRKVFIIKDSLGVLQIWHVNNVYDRFHEEASKGVY